ncbi:hypothetical protein L1987_38893 [Smallanthus sonchifolius]|uniref:Uncharacterized protein n=1 Tax=Smallanthus sonchifolius TaxID=185202 RepID=A0ACB9HN04_9ASTR|nr:hypothetical protein L1987_38893 [Smallanthus sonchifolius]
MECRRKNQPTEHLDACSEKYLRMDLMRSERHLWEPCFTCQVEHPSKFILNYIATPKIRPELRQEAWNLACVSLYTTLCVRFKSAVVAGRVVYVGFPAIKVCVPGKPPLDYQRETEVKHTTEFALKQVKALLKSRLRGKTIGGLGEKSKLSAPVEPNSEDIDFYDDSPTVKLIPNIMSCRNRCCYLLVVNVNGDSIVLSLSYWYRLDLNYYSYTNGDIRSAVNKSDSRVTSNRTTWVGPLMVPKFWIGLRSLTRNRQSVYTTFMLISWNYTMSVICAMRDQWAISRSNKLSKKWVIRSKWAKLGLSRKCVIVYGLSTVNQTITRIGTAVVKGSSC